VPGSSWSGGLNQLEDGRLQDAGCNTGPWDQGATAMTDDPRTQDASIPSRGKPTRRDVLKVAGGAAAVVAAATLMPTSSPSLTPDRRRYAIVGTGSRGSGMWGRDLVRRYDDLLEFVGLCDVNPVRVEVARGWLGVDCPTFTDFDRMCDTVKPELLAITTVDAAHADYIVRALDRGIEVITEKPMVIDERQCQAVLDAEKRNGRGIIVTFNARYTPKHIHIKEILQGAELGRVTSVDLNWYLDVHHGADYFRRWHRLKSQGGSLFVHKASHHFDLINWWLDADPVEVHAYGEIRRYGRSGPFRHTHCRPCPHKHQCEFFYDIMRDARQMELYVSAEGEDGYLRDGCVFREDVDAWDTMSAVVKYSNDVMMSYSLNAFMPFEGYRLAFNCEHGRLEVRDYQRQPWTPPDETEIAITRNFGEQRMVQVPAGVGAHGGGDDRLRDLIFRESEVPAHLRLPDSRAGAMSCLTGIAARKSIEERRPVRIDEMVKFT
jgi:predicted dehydrogenase